MFTRTCIAVAVAITTLALVPASERVSAADEPLLVIAGATFPVNDISLAALKDAFSGRSATVSGKRIIPINHPLESPLRVSYDRAILGLEPAAVGRFWVDKRIRAEGNPPTTASTAELAVRIVASLPAPKDELAWGAYALLGYRFDWIGLMPYVVVQGFDYTEASQSSKIKTNGVTGGFNIRPIDAVALKIEYVYGRFPDGYLLTDDDIHIFQS